MNMAGSRLLLVCLLVKSCLAYPYFRDALPNGHNVPHPCIEGDMWDGVGHENHGGGGTRNVFGQDFNQNGRVWNAAICNKDSDGDGKTNGEELGDPDCEWTPGTNPKYTTGLSHPGICEPFESSQCGGKPSFVDCQDTSLKNCKVLDEPETFNFTVRFPETPVPAQETTYTCITFELPMDNEYHLVAYDPIIDNQEVMHHTLVFGCDGVDEAPGPLNQPKECGGEMDGCREIIALWGVGGKPYCSDENMGFLTGGTKGLKYAVMQHHWNNPQLRSDYVDSSGMVFHMTPKLRPNNAGTLMIGQFKLDIPPGAMAYSSSGSCHGDCTEQIMDGPIQISVVLNHMHLLGRAQYTEKIRNGISLPLAMDPVYDYNTPIYHEYSTPIKMNPGDELKTTCRFKSKSRNVTTNFGDATADEMCLAFLTYYPKENIRTGECVAWKSLSKCEYQYQTVRRGCDFGKLNDPNDPDTNKMYEDLYTLCSIGFCRRECLDYVRELKKQPCFIGDVGDFYRSTTLSYTRGEQRNQVIEYFSRLDSCDSMLAIENFKLTIDDETSAATIFLPTHIMMTSLIVLVSFFQ